MTELAKATIRECARKLAAEAERCHLAALYFSDPRQSANAAEVARDYANKAIALC